MIVTSSVDDLEPASCSYLPNNTISVGGGVGINV